MWSVHASLWRNVFTLKWHKGSLLPKILLKYNEADPVGSDHWHDHMEEAAKYKPHKSWVFYYFIAIV